MGKWKGWDTKGRDGVIECDKGRGKWVDWGWEDTEGRKGGEIVKI